MLLQGESMSAAHVLEAGANRCGEGAVQSVRRKARPPCDADPAVRCAECKDPDAAPATARNATAPSVDGARAPSPPTAPGPCRTHPPSGAQPCTASPSIPSPPPAARLHRSRPEHPREGRPSPTEMDAVRTRTVLAPRPVTPDTLEADAFVLCRAELRYSAREALHRRLPGRARRGNRQHGFCELPASRRGPGVADRAGSTGSPPETNDR